jgi:DNA polymerase III epsilon subunit family exonuclease
MDLLMRERTDYESLQNPQTVFVAFDLETTGLSPQYDRIVEIGAVKFVDGREIVRFNALVNPGMPMPAGASSVNGIIDAMLAGKPAIEAVLPEFLEFITGSVLVAHNAQFDLGFVSAALRKQGKGVLPNDFVDTQPMSRRAWPGRQNYKLQSLASDLGVKSIEAHRAEDDARVCMEVFLAGLRKLNPGGQTSFF